MTKTSISGIFAAVIGAIAICGNASAVTLVTPLPAALSSLTTGGSFAEGDKTFSSWQYDTLGTAPAASDITVNSFPTGQYGVIFASDWEADSVASGPLSTATSVITYTLQVASGHAVNSVDLDLAGLAVGDSFATVHETVMDLQNGHNYSLTVSTKTGFSVATSLSILPSNHLELIKSITVQSGTNAGAGDAIISTVENSFHQTAVPEPMSLTLVPMALAALGLRKKLSH